MGANLAALVTKDLKPTKSQFVAKYDGMLERMLDNICPQMRAELESAGRAYRPRAIINILRGLLLVGSLSKRDVLRFWKKAQVLSITPQILDALIKLHDQLVAELQKDQKDTWLRLTPAIDNEVDSAANTFILEYPEMEAKTRAALAAAKAHFRAELANL